MTSLITDSVAPVSTSIRMRFTVDGQRDTDGVVDLASQWKHVVHVTLPIFRNFLYILSLPAYSANVPLFPTMVAGGVFVPTGGGLVVTTAPITVLIAVPAGFPTRGSPMYIHSQATPCVHSQAPPCPL